MLRFDARAGCWLWTGALHTTGYGVLGRGRRGEGLVRAHRLAWELVFGPVPAGLLVCHECDVRACCNPGHLFLGTYVDNMQDMSAKDRASKPAAKLRPRDILKIRELKKQGMTNAAIADRFDIKPRQVRKIASRSQWKHVA